MSPTTTGPRVFVSHAYADKVFVDSFVNNILIRGAGLRSAEIFYSSAVDTGVRSGQNLMEILRREAGTSHLVIALITPTYQTRPVCVAELGAAWAREVLFPLIAPSVSRSQLEGVLPGLLVPPVSDDGALDDLADRIRDLDFRVESRSFGIGKESWRSALSAGIAPATVDAIPTAEEVKQLRADLKAAQDALDRTRVELESERVRNDKLSRAKSAADLTGANLPADETERFELIRSGAQQAVSALGGVVSEVLWHRIAGQEMCLPDRMDDPRTYEAIQKEAKAGRLEIDVDSGEVTVDPDFPEVERALLAATELGKYLDEADRSEAFTGWFRKSFRVPMNLSKKRCWDAIFGDD